jgi:O-antigen/teichoic acid export membrane protein
MKFIQNSLITLLTRVLTFLFGICVLVITTRALGPQGRGVFEMIILVLMVSKTVSSLGIEVGNVYFIGRKRIPVQRLASNSLVFSAVLGSATVLLFILAMKAVPLSFLSDVPQKYLIQGIFVLPFILLFTFFSMLLLGENRFLEFNLVTLIHPALFALVLVFGMFFLNVNVPYVVYSWIGIYGLAGIVTLSIQKRHTSIPFRFYPGEARKTVVFGLKAYLANLIQFFNLRLDLFLINYFLNLKEVGYYSLSVRMAEILLYLPNAVSTVVFPKVANSEHAISNRDTPIICRNVVLLLLLSALLFALLAHILFPVLFSEKFTAALKPFLYLLPGIIALGCSKVLSNDVAGRGRPEINMIIAAITLTLNILLNIVLIPRLGIIGASLSSSVTYSLTMIILVILYKRMTGIPFRDLLIARKSDIRYYRQFFDQTFRRERKG